MMILPGIASLSDKFDGILLDAYGVFWGGNDYGLLPKADTAMERLVASGKIVGVLSNSTQLAAKEINKLSRHGLVQGRHYHFLLTSGEIARTVFLHEELPFATPRKTFCLFGEPHPKFSSHADIFNGSPYHEVASLEEADFVYISVPHVGGEDQTDPERFRPLVAKIRAIGLPMVCANPDRFAHEGNPPKAVVRQGTIASLYEEIGGQVFYVGKPYEKAYAAALRHFATHHILDPKRILMVGDTPETDVRGARSCGIPAALVTQTGIMAERVAHKGLEQALAALPPQDYPNFLIERFADGICATR